MSDKVYLLPLSRAVLCFGSRLSGLTLTAALVVQVWADASHRHLALLQSYAAELTTLALVPLAAGLAGALLLEDMLRRLDT